MGDLAASAATRLGPGTDRGNTSDRAIAHTGARLGAALLGYFALVTLVITVSPFDFAPRPFKLSWLLAPGDIIANIALFLPLGFLVRGLAGDSRDRWRAVWPAAVFSLLIEFAQIFIQGRYVSPVDVATNTAGAYLGVILRDRVERWVLWHPRLAGRIGLDIPLVGLLYLLVPQLWLSSVGLVDDPRRSVTTLLLGCAGSIVLVALRRHRWRGGVRLAVDGRRFEVDTLRRFVPLFSLYVVIAALWPALSEGTLVRSPLSWHGALAFGDRLNDAGVVDLLLLLEHVGGFTLLGYAAAEWTGRRELTLAADLPRIAVPATFFAAALELVQGMSNGPGASLARALLSTGGALYGAAVYHLARAHVRALRARVGVAVDSIDRAA